MRLEYKPEPMDPEAWRSIPRNGMTPAKWWAVRAAARAAAREKDAPSRNRR
jgi:hypothetical protein